ncbi:hypothetical protein ACLOAU_14690 [Niabella sp. CJ426]|uniref:hypothetical protein n=1 Tax=Niabella sp. CJ426 TaxID=3393740 RepID=UPI003CFC59C7
MKKLIGILKGWCKKLGIISTTSVEIKLSELRLKQCQKCSLAKKSKILEFMNGGAEYVDTIYCTKCKCPAVQKSLVVEEYCPVGKW